MTVSVEDRPVQEAPAPAPVKTEPVPESAPTAEDYATFDDLMSKKARERDITVNVSGRSLKMHLRAIGHVAYDQLIAQCPASKEDQAKGLVYDENVFGPKLIAAVVTRPKMDLDRANRLWNDPNWAGGEVGWLYRQCIQICQVGLDVPFTESG